MLSEAGSSNGRPVEVEASLPTTTHNRPISTRTPDGFHNGHPSDLATPIATAKPEAAYSRNFSSFLFWTQAQGTIRFHQATSIAECVFLC
jgi:hypothetical protein